MKKRNVATTIIFLILTGYFTFGSSYVNSEKNGFIKGDSGSINGNVFPVIVEKFDLIISNFESVGHEIQLTIPVSEISTDNWMRDIHMRISVLDASKDDIIFNAHYMGNLKDGFPEGKYNLIGNLTINGITKSNKVNLNFYRINGKDFVKGSALVSLKNYNIIAPGLGGMKVIDKISIIIDLVL